MTEQRLVTLSRVYQSDPNVCALINELRVMRVALEATTRGLPLKWDAAIRDAEATGQLTDFMREDWQPSSRRTEGDETPPDELSPEDEMRALYRRACASLRECWSTEAEIEALHGGDSDPGE